MLTIPDQVQRQVYLEDIAPHLRDGQTLMFAHGFNIHFNQIVAAAGRRRQHGGAEGPGAPGAGGVRRGLRRARPCSPSTRTPRGRRRTTPWPTPRASAPTRAGVLETTFLEETETDLFGEQAVLCGGVSALVKAAFETLVEAGYQPELAYFETLHELKLIVDLMYQGGLDVHALVGLGHGGVRRLRHRAARRRRPRRATLKQILTEIQDGEFAKRWILENQAGRPAFLAMRRREQDAPHRAGGQGAALDDELAERASSRRRRAGRAPS